MITLVMSLLVISSNGTTFVQERFVRPPRSRPGSPVVNPRKFVLQKLCEDPSIESEILFQRLRRSGFPMSGEKLFNSIYEELMQKTRMSNHIHSLLVDIALEKNIEYNNLLLGRRIESFVRKGLDNDAIMRNISLWNKNCVHLLVCSTQEPPCTFIKESDEWVLNNNQARDLFCAEYQAVILQ